MFAAAPNPVLIFREYTLITAGVGIFRRSNLPRVTADRGPVFGVSSKSSGEFDRQYAAGSTQSRAQARRSCADSGVRSDSDRGTSLNGDDGKLKRIIGAASAASEAGDCLVFHKPPVGRCHAIFERNPVTPAERSEAPNVKKFARGAVGLGGIETERA